MKKYLLILITIFFIGCGGFDNENSDLNSSINENRYINGNFDRNYYGKWVRVDTGEYKDIISTTYIQNYTIKNDNLIEVIDDNGTVYHLARAGNSDIKVSGKILDDSSNSRYIRYVGGINVILKNILDLNIKAEATTDQDGNFITSSLPSGTYNVIASKDSKLINTTINIQNKVEDIGTYKLLDSGKQNFKAELIMNDEFLYADDMNHTGVLRVHNLSDQIGVGLNYQISIDDNLLKSIWKDNIKGSVEPHSYMDIPIKIAFKQMINNSKKINVNVKIQDAYRNSWNDTFEIDLYKGYFNINIATEENRVKGYLVMPDTHKIKVIDIDGKGSIRVPLLSNETYHMLLSNPSYEYETAYSIGLNKAPEDFSTFEDTSAHEPNNQESTAKTIELNSVTTSYLHGTDMDYWKISTPESGYLFDHNLGSFNTLRDINLSKIVTSNTITITDKLTNGKTIPISIDKGTIILNGIDTNTTTVNVETNDTVAIKLQSPSKDSSKISSTMLLGQNSLIFTVKSIDTTAPIFISKNSFNVYELQRVAFTAYAKDFSNINYSIIEGDNYFDINSTTGIVVFKNIPDYEVKNSYTLTVKAIDESMNSSKQNVKINILDVEPEKIRSSDGIVTDLQTGLMWQDIYDGDIKEASLSIAKSYCRQLKLGNYTDWYLPSSDKLETIVDYEKTNPAISDIFINIKSHDYWTSSYYYYYGNRYYYIDFSSGDRHATEYDYREKYVRCVRNDK